MHHAEMAAKPARETAQLPAAGHAPVLPSTFGDQGTGSVAQRALLQLIMQGPRVETQRASGVSIHSSPRIAAQGQQVRALFGGAVQLPGGPHHQAPAQGQHAAAQFRPDHADVSDRHGDRALRALDPINPSGMRASVQAKMERSFQTDFSGVRIHEQSSLATGIGAIAAAKGNEIHFAPGAYQPDSPSGQEVLGHELAHVVQQRAGRVATAQAKDDASVGGTTLNVDHALEQEADDMGARAARGEPVTIAGSGTSASGEVIQPLFGFEIEMLVLVDRGGRPVREKTRLGTVGAHLRLDVDHGPAVAAPVPQNVGAAIASAESVNYDLPPGGVARMVPNQPGDTRLQPLHLVPATWLGATAGPEYARGVANGLDNTALGVLDTLVAQYDDKQRNWASDSADARLDAILVQILAWRAGNPSPGALDGAGLLARGMVDATLEQLRVEADAHKVFWSANPPVPQGMVREYSVPDGLGPGGMTPFTTDHPEFGGMGTDTYASIIEIVTNAYPPETPAGQQDILAAMNAAVAFAGALEGTAGADLTGRAPLDGVGGAVIADPTIHFGNALQPAQTTKGSFQTTGAIDLAQFPSFVLSMTAPMPVEAGQEDRANPNNEYFDLKHHSDDDDHVGDRVRLELPLAVANATTAVNAIKVLGPGAPGMSNLRGLVVMICQYLRMGRHFYGHGAKPLGKNVVPFLSRTDMADVYERLVPRTGVTATDEKAWLEGIPPMGAATRLQTLMAQILNATGRAGASDLFNDAAESSPGGGSGGSCDDLLDNVFTQGSDVVTNLLGVLTMGPESVDPAAARHGDSRYGGGAGGAAATEREGVVFEMRNMAKREYGEDRFPSSEWLKLAEQEIAVARTLNARTEASASHDQRTRLSGFGQPGGPNRTRATANDEPNW